MSLTEWMKSEAKSLRREAARIEKSEFAVSSAHRIADLRARAERLETEAAAR